MKRCVARRAVKDDARFDPVEDERVALGLRDADVGLGVNLQIDGAAVGKLAADDIAGALPAALVGEQRMVDDDPKFVIGKVDRPTVFIPTSPRVRTDQDDAFDLSLDDLESELDRDLQATGDSTSMNDLSLDNDMDFALSLDDSNSSSVTPADDLADFSLDLDAPATPAETAEDDFLLSLDDEPTAVPAVAEPSFDLPADEAADDFDLSADFDLSLNDEEPAQPSSDSFAAQLDEVSAELDLLSDDLDPPAAFDAPTSADTAALDDDDFDFLSGTDETATKLDLARAYIDMGDTEGARDILDEVITEGNEGQQQEARELIAKLV